MARLTLPRRRSCFEFGPHGEFLREIGKGLYAWSEAHSVRIDKDDNIWAIDKGSDMIIKFNPAGRVVWVFGRRKEGADEDAKPWEHPDPPLAAIDGLFRQPTDVTWDSEGNIYISDGYVNSRVAKYDKNGDWVKSWGDKGTASRTVPTCRTRSWPTATTIFMWRTAPIGESRCSIPTANFCACSPSTCLPIRRRAR